MGDGVTAVPAVCAHCQRGPKGHAATADGRPLCHPEPPDMDCYRLVTVYGHETPCDRCAAGPRLHPR